jgi:ligand-binding sensor domain-containing protein/signal transduction histidine kinase
MNTAIRFGLFILLAAVALVADESVIVPRRSHDIWNRASGFPGGYVYSMTQTADGYLWIGTSNGLLRYDGLSFVFIRTANSIAAINGPIQGLVTDSSDHLWATDEYTHLFRYDTGLLQGPLPDNGRHQHLVSAAGKTFDGWLLFVSELQGIVEYTRGERRVLLEGRQLPGAPTAVAQTADGTIWIGTNEKGLFHFNPDKGDRDVQQVPNLADKKINCLLPIANTTLLIGTNKGLFGLRRDRLISEIRPELEHDEILALASGQNGDLWIGTDGHVFKAHAQEIDAEGKIRSLEDLVIKGTVTALFEDRDGNLWIGEPEAIERYRDTSFSSYLSSAGLPCINCGTVYVDSQQSVWFAPSDGGLFRILHGRGVQPVVLEGLKEDRVYSIAGAENEVWVARRDGGLSRIDLQSGELRGSTYSHQNGFPQDSAYSVYRQSDGTVWAGTLSHGVSRFHNGSWRTFTHKDGLPSDTITAMTGNTAGEIFVGTPIGLAEFRNDRWITYRTHDGLPPGVIDSLYVGDAGTVWIGTSRGIAFLRSGAVHVPLGAPNALYGDILGIAESSGWLWVTTPDHVLRVRSTALLKENYAEGDYREFGVTDGLPSTNGVKGSQSVVPDDRGNIWFSLNQGISVLHPPAFAGPAFPVTVRIDGILVDGKSVGTGNGIRIPSGRHRLTFQYAAVNVSNPEGVRYRYRLSDIESTWSEPTASREIDFTNILPGRFQFQVAASNPDGVWSPHEAAIAFEIEPSLFQTRWFQLGIVGVLSLVALGIYRLRVQQLHRQFHVGLEARVQERTRIARDLHDTLLQTLHGLMFQFQAVRNLMPRKPDAAMRSLDDAITETEKALAESRDAIQGLRSEPIAKGNLAELLMSSSQELAHSGTTNHETPVFELIEEGQRQTLSPNSKNEVCRIALEILRNAYQHSHAQRIEAEIRYGDHSLRVRIRDDGAGIDPKVLKEGGREGHWGLRGVRERAERIGAHLDFWSESGAGTEIQLTVPASVAYETSRDGVGSKLLRKMGDRGQHT